MKVKQIQTTYSKTIFETKYCPQKFEISLVTEVPEDVEDIDNFIQTAMDYTILQVTKSINETVEHTIVEP